MKSAKRAKLECDVNENPNRLAEHESLSLSHLDSLRSLLGFPLFLADSPIALSSSNHTTSIELKQLVTKALLWLKPEVTKLQLFINFYQAFHPTSSRLTSCASSKFRGHIHKLTEIKFMSAF